MAIVKLQTDKVSCSVSVCLKEIYLKIIQTLLTNTLFKRQNPGVWHLMGSQCDCNLAEVPEKSSETSIRLYMVRLEVVCVLFNRISTWTDSFSLISLMNSVFQPGVFPIGVDSVARVVVLTLHLPRSLWRFRKTTYRVAQLSRYSFSGLAG